MDIVSDLCILDGSKLKVDTSNLVFNDLDGKTFSEFKNNLVVNNADSFNAIAIGNDASTDSSSSIAIGNNSKAHNTAIAIGYLATASSDRSIVIGDGNGSTTYENGEKSVSVGFCSQAKGLESISIGFCSQAKGTESISLGLRSFADTHNSIAIGVGSLASNFCAIAIGDYATTEAMWALAFGTGAQAQFTRSTAIGFNAKTSGCGETVFSAWSDDGNKKTQFSIIGEGSTLANSEFGGCAGITYATYRPGSTCVSEFGSTKLSDIVKTSKIFTSDNEFTGSNTFKCLHINGNTQSYGSIFSAEGCTVQFCNTSLISLYGEPKTIQLSSTNLQYDISNDGMANYKLKFRTNDNRQYNGTQYFAYESDLPKYETVSNVEVPADCSAFSMPFTKSFKNCPTYSFVDNEFNTVIADIKFVKDTNTSEFNSATVSVEHDTLIPANSYQLNVFGY